jgi:hypothetical protein
MSDISSSRRWLIIFTIIVGILVVATISLVLLTKENKAALLPENTPQGTVQRYLIAVQEKDYQSAFNYISFDPQEKIQTYYDWISMLPQMSSQSEWKATLGKTTQNGDNATVEITIDTFRPGGPFANSVSSQQLVFQMVKIDGKWLIRSPTYIYWIY